ncbi:MAG: DNA polymerase III subunit delta' [Alphaproteobacteria bacterium]
MTDNPEPDAIMGAPHPRHTMHLLGQSAAEAEFLAAWNLGRLHHAWLISGPRGVGKATLAWRLARFLLATPAQDGGMFAPPSPTTLDIADTHPVRARMLALAESRLFLLRRPWDDKNDRARAEITVDEVRRLKSYFALSAADGGQRVAIIDAVDDMNINAANALLKLLEEPPARVTLLLIAHQPARLLPTIRSRCRELRLMPLSADDLSAALTGAGGDVAPQDSVALAELAGGSVGAAFALTNLDGLKLYTALIRLFATLPRLDRPMALALAEQGGRRGAEPIFDLIVTLIDLFLSRLARAGTLSLLPPEAARGEQALIERLSPDRQAARAWADLAQSLGNRARRGRAVNLDPAALLLDMVLKIDEVAGMLAQR